MLPRLEMKIVIFGLTLSSSWGNGHATLWRGLIRALARMGHKVVFFERDVPYYAQHRDLTSLPGAQLRLYEGWSDVASGVRRELLDADVMIVTSYCVDAIAAFSLSLEVAPGVLRVFYDLDTPITLARLRLGQEVEYLPPDGLRGFDLTLSYTGGAALQQLRSVLGSRSVAALYGHVDPDVHRPVASAASDRADLSYLGTYAADRQPGLERLFIEPARRHPERRFVIGGSGYPDSFPWTPNIFFVRHVTPPGHPAFFCSSRLTLNVTRTDMARLGFCPSGRLFEAAACGIPLLSDSWAGIEQFFVPDAEILIAETPEEVTGALQLSDLELGRIAQAARERVCSEHTSMHRARELLELLEATLRGSSATPSEPPTAGRSLPTRETSADRRSLI